MKHFRRTCSSLTGLLTEWKPDNAMGLWSVLHQEFWQTLGQDSHKTKQIVAFSRYCSSRSSQASVRQGVDYAFGEHLLDYPEAFPAMAKCINVADLDHFAERLIRWNGKKKYSLRRKKLEEMIKAEPSPGTLPHDPAGRSDVQG